MQHLAGNARGVVPICRKCRCFSEGNKVDIVGVHSSILCTPTIQLLENNRPDGQKTKRPVGSTNLRGFPRSTNPPR